MDCGARNARSRLPRMRRRRGSRAARHMFGGVAGKVIRVDIETEDRTQGWGVAILSVAMGIPARAAISHPNIEVPIRAEQQVPTIVVGIRLTHLDYFGDLTPAGDVGSRCERNSPTTR